MAGTPVLRISDVPSGGARRVEVIWQDGPARQAVVSTFAYQAGEADAEKVRWYLEDYAEFPADPGPRLARDAEAILAGTGASLFGHVFTGLDAAGIWDRARARLSQVRVEIDTDPAEAPGLPWELLRDPGTDTALALGAGEFVRTHLQAARSPSLPEAGGDRLRVLLVICRPGGREDVPFRSVASRLVRGGAEQMPGLELDVLRPATSPRLAQVLHAAADVGRPYHVVHFDGHGTYLDLTTLANDDEDEDDSSTATADDAASGSRPASGGGNGGGVGVSPLRYAVAVAGPVRAGQHGYLIFENPGDPSNQQLADGPTLGKLLTATGVPVLVLNACRSAFTEVSSTPGQPGDTPGGPGGGAQPADEADPDSGPPADVHSRIRAYGSLAAEVADAGVPGVVAMRYNVYVVTAAQYTADLYAHLLVGKPLGQAATAARRALADDPARQITTTPVDLQDWAVPVIYEAAPLTLLRPQQRDVPLIKLSTSDGDTAAADAGGGVPGPPDAGFFGRDETLLALDRAFDTQQVVLLHAFAGAGKSSTAAEFARWYQSTGGLDHPDLGPGPVLWSNFEHHLRVDRLLDAAGDCFSGLLEANGIHWQATTDPGVRRDLIVQVLAQVPVLWVWDNIEPVTGFPPGTQSAWSQAEQDDLAGFLRDLATKTRCKVLVTSRRDEQAWLGGLPARLALPPMPMRERLQLATALAKRHGQVPAGVDWRPLLRYTAGNPLTITVLTGQALREGLATTAQVEAFVDRLRAGEAELEPGEDAALGRTRSLAASLSYGFAHAFTDAERGQLAVLHLFRDTIDADALRAMGDRDIAEGEAVPQLAGLTRETVIALLDRAADIGLLSGLGGGYYAIHPALPWYFTTLFAAAYGPPASPPARQAARAYTHTVAQLGDYYHHQGGDGAGDPVPTLRVEEANLLHALALARHAQHWADTTSCLQGLSVLYQRTGRDGEWARLVEQVTPEFIAPATGGPLPGRENHWNVITNYQVQLAMAARDWPTATRLQQALITQDRDQAAAALATPGSQLTPGQRHQIRSLAVTLEQLANILRFQGDPGCLPYFEEALSLYQRTGARTEEANLALSLGNAYLTIPGVRDPGQAEHWYQHSLTHRADNDTLGRAKTLWGIGMLAYARFGEARDAGEPGPVLLAHLNTALDRIQQALNLFPADDAEDLAGVHGQIGNIYRQKRDTRQALRHYQQSIAHQEARGDTYGAGATRFNIALLLEEADRRADALLYAHAALSDFENVGPGAAQVAADTRDLITRLERNSG